MTKKSVFKKGFIIGIIILFVGASVIPSISGTYDYNTTGQIKNLNFYDNPPEEEWNKTYGGTGDDWGFSVQQISDGGYIIIGWTSSYGNGNDDVWLIKTDSTGSEVWNKTYGGTELDRGRSGHQTTDGGYIIVGYTESYGAGKNDTWLIKTDSNGDVIWTKTFGGSDDDYGLFIQQTTDGGYIIVAFRFLSVPKYHDIWLIKTDSNGDMEWDKTFDVTSHNYGYSIQQTSDGGYIITGYIYFPEDQNFDVWLIKTDSNGNMEWDKTYGGTEYDSGWSVKQTSDGGYILTGYTESYGAGDGDVWLIKTNSNGDEEWNKTFGGPSFDEGWCVQQTNDDGYILTGRTESFGAGNRDVWLIKTNINGGEEWNKTFGGTEYERGRYVQQTHDGGYIITGLTESYGSGDSDAWLIKVAPDNGENQPPSEPEISGETNGDVGTEYDYEFTNCIDPDGDDMTYHVEWDDGGVDEGFVESGGGFTLTHSWSEKGDYTIRAKLIDDYGAESDWAELQVTMPRNRLLQNTFLMRLLERFPNLFPIIRQIIGL